MINENELPKNWEVVKLGDFANEIRPGFASGDHNSVGKGHLHFRPYNITSKGQIDLCMQKFVPLKNEDYLLKKGDIIFNNTNSPELLGKTTYINKDTDWVFSNHMTRIRVRENLSSTFIANYLQFLFYQGYYRINCSNHVNQASISSNYLKNFVEIPLPPLAEQKRIVAKIEEIFSELDAGQKSLKTAQTQLKTYRQAVLKDAFEGKLTNNYINKGKLPNSWEWKTVGDICSSVEYGSAIKSKQLGKVPVLRMGNIQDGKFDWEDLVYTSDEIEIKKYLLKKNDVLFNRTNSAELVGKTAIYKGERPAIFAGYLIRINRIESLVDASYLTYFLNSHNAKSYGNTVKSFGVNQSNINGTKLKTYPIPVPTLREQQCIVEEIESRLSVCDKLEATISTSLKQAESLRQSILKKAFEGKLI